MVSTRTLLFWLTALAAFAGTVPGFSRTDPATARAAGATALAAGDWEKARDALEAARETTGSDPGLQANLGLAYRELGETGRAVLAWERALALQPWHWEVRALLDDLRDARGLPEPGMNALRSWAGWLPEWLWTILAFLCFWWLVWRLVLPRRSTGRRQPWLALPVFLLTGAGCLFWMIESGRGVVVSDDTPLKVAPTAESPAALTLPAGRTGRVTDRFQDHVSVVLDTGERGWLSVEHFHLIRPGPADREADNTPGPASPG
ncbi:MAG: tetratricopeptide repeat protein [Opitutales bacterium]